MWFHLKLALELGFPSIGNMLSQMSAYDLRLWEAYYYIDSGQYEKVKKRKDAPKLIRESLKHLVKKKNG